MVEKKVEEYVVTKKNISEIWPEVDGFGKTKYPDFKLPTFEWASKNDDIPSVKDDFVYNPEHLYPVLMGLRFRTPVLISGHTGCGKTTMMTQIAARTKMEFCRVNFDRQITRSDIIGEPIAKNMETQFLYGVVPKALLRPTILLLDEWDRIQPQVSFVFQRLLEQDGKLLILENGGEIITPHIHNRIVATGNTMGLGDEEGIYQAADHQDFAQIRRFGIFVKMEYLEQPQEEDLLKRCFKKVHEQGKLTDQEISSFCQVAVSLRSGFVNHQISVPFSTGTLIGWVKLSLILQDKHRAADYAFLNMLGSEDKRAADEIIQRAF